MQIKVSYIEMDRGIPLNQDRGTHHWGSRSDLQELSEMKGSGQG